jgi:hypothetical protein
MHFADSFRGKGLEDDDVCEGAIGLEGPILAHDLRQMTIGTKTSQLFCLTIFGLCEWPAVDTDLPFTLSEKPDTSRPSSSGKSAVQVVQISDIHVEYDYVPTRCKIVSDTLYVVSATRWEPATTARRISAAARTQRMTSQVLPTTLAANTGTRPATVLYRWNAVCTMLSSPCFPIVTSREFSPADIPGAGLSQHK